MGNGTQYRHSQHKTAAPLVISGELANTLTAKYKSRISRYRLFLLLMAALTVISFCLDVISGPFGLTLRELFDVLIDPLAHGKKVKVVVWNIRLPIAIMAIFVGVSLAISGVEMQTILNNPLADPFTLGISSGASLGAALTIVLNLDLVPWLEDYIIVSNAFIFAMGASMTIYSISKLRGVTTESMILTGIAIMFLCGSFITILQMLATEYALQELTFWTMGSLVRANWQNLAIFGTLMGVCIPFFVVNAWKLTALRLGDNHAKSLGVAVESLRLRTMMCVSLMAAITVSFVGIIGFVGLVAPHIARLLVGEEQRIFLPAAGLIGALLVSITSIISKTLVPGILLPIGVITSVIGIPFFMSVIMYNRKKMW